MAIKRTYYEEYNLVVSIFYGKLTNAELGQHVIEMNECYSDRRAVNELADCTRLTDVSELSGEGVAFSAALESGQSRVFESRGAIVVASDAVYGLARAYAAFAREARMDSRVYRSIDEAIAWLDVAPLRSDILALADSVAG